MIASNPLQQPSEVAVWSSCFTDENTGAQKGQITRAVHPVGKRKSRVSPGQPGFNAVIRQFYPTECSAVMDMFGICADGMVAPGHVQLFNP